MNMNKQHLTLLVLLGLSAAFGTVDHVILLNRLNSNFCISGRVLYAGSAPTYTTGRNQCLLMEKHPGVPQGSCLGPLLFILYVSKLFTIANAIYQKCTHMLTTRNCTLPSNRLMLSQLCKHALLTYGSGC